MCKTFYCDLLGNNNFIWKHISYQCNLALKVFILYFATVKINYMVKTYIGSTDIVYQPN